MRPCKTKESISGSFRDWSSESICEPTNLQSDEGVSRSLAGAARRYFEANPGSQEKAFEAVRRASETIDRKHGTNVTEVFKTVVDQKEFRAF
jgi:hypothetical protein